MPEVWLPGAIRMISPDPNRRGGSMTGGGKRYFTHHTFEGRDVQHRMTAEQGARALISSGNVGHFCGSLITGQIVQMVPANLSCYLLENPPGGIETNKAGDIHMQIEWLAEAKDPWTEYATEAGWDLVGRLMDFAKSWGIPLEWPAGKPAATSSGPHNRIGPGDSGHYGHSQWKEQLSGHWDPGALDIVRILNSSSTVLPDADVIAIQKQLVEAGYLKPSDVDGFDGPITQKAWSLYMTDITDLRSDVAKLKEIVERGFKRAPREVWAYPLKGRDASSTLRIAAGGLKTDSNGNEVVVPIVPPPI